MGKAKLKWHPKTTETGATPQKEQYNNADRQSLKGFPCGRLFTEVYTLQQKSLLDRCLTYFLNS